MRVYEGTTEEDHALIMEKVLNNVLSRNKEV